MRWEPVLASLNKKPELVIRANSLKTTPKELLVILRKEGILAEPIDGNPDALFIKEKINVFKLPSFNAGLFEVQDAASQMVSRILDPQPGMRVVDACAGEGSKTLHLAALLKNKGKIIAMDTQEWRLRELRKRAAKAGVDTIETRLITSSKIYKRMKETADRLLLDVPCSGLGTLQRNPDIRWKLTAKDLERLRDPTARPSRKILYTTQTPRQHGLFRLQHPALRRRRADPTIPQEPCRLSSLRMKNDIGRISIEPMDSTSHFSNVPHSIVFKTI